MSVWVTPRLNCMPKFSLCSIGMQVNTHTITIATLPKLWNKVQTLACWRHNSSVSARGLHRLQGILTYMVTLHTPYTPYTPPHLTRWASEVWWWVVISFDCYPISTLTGGLVGITCGLQGVSSVFSCDQAALQMVFSVCPSVCPSVCLSPLFYYVPMIVSS